MSETETLDRGRSESEIMVSNILSSADCPRRQLQTTCIDADSEWRGALEHLKPLVGTGFICALIGKRGTGKTQIAVETIRESASRLRRAKYLTAMEFFLAIKASYRKDSETTEQEVLASFYSPCLLVLDEIQERGETEWEDRLLTHLIDKRYAAMKDTLLLSNLTEEEFKKSVGPSIISRLIETGGIIECNWSNFRSKKGS